MDWENEPYIRVYTRDTADSLAMGWEGRHVFREIKCRASRAGVLDIVDPDVIADLIRTPRDIVRTGLRRLLERQCVVIGSLKGKPVLVIPNFIEAQEANQSDRQRKKEQRARQRDLALLKEIELVVTKRDEMSGDVFGLQRLLPGDFTENGAQKAIADHPNEQSVTNSDAVVTNRDGMSGERATMSRFALLSFAKLESEDGAVAPPPVEGKKPPAKKAKPPAHPDRRAVMDAWHQAYEQAYSEKPHWGAKERGIADRLAKTHGAAKVLERIARLFSSPPDWLKGPYTVGTLEANWNAIVGGGKPVPVEHARMEKWG